MAFSLHFLFPESWRPRLINGVHLRCWWLRSDLFVRLIKNLWQRSRSKPLGTKHDKTTFQSCSQHLVSDKVWTYTTGKETLVCEVPTRFVAHESFRFGHLVQWVCLQKSLPPKKGAGQHSSKNPKTDRHIWDVGVSKNRGTPKSSSLIGFSIINHPFWGTTIFGNIHVSNQNLQDIFGWPRGLKSWTCKSLLLTRHWLDVHHLSKHLVIPRWSKLLQFAPKMVKS